MNIGKSTIPQLQFQEMNVDAGHEQIQAELFRNQLLCMIVSAALNFYEIHAELFFNPIFCLSW